MKKEFNRLFTMGIVLVATALVFSCKKTNNNKSDPGSSDPGTFSVTLNGKTMGGSGTINAANVIIAQNDTASFTPDGDIFLYMQDTGDSIGFHLPDRTGTTVVGGVNTPSHIYGVFTVPADVYLFDSVTVNVTTLTSTRIKGTFSGHLSTSLLANQGDQADITNGSFDLPVIP